MTASSVVRGVDSRTSGGSAVTGVVVTHTAPAGVASGDLLVVGMQLREPPTTLTGWRVPTGWTARTALTSSGSGSYAIYTAKYGTDVTGTSWTWDNGAGNTTVTRWSSCLVALVGSQVTGVAGHAAQSVSATTSPTSPSLTTAAQTVLVGFAGSRTSGGVSYTPPPGWVEQSDRSESTITNAVTLEVSVNDTTPAPTGTYAYAPVTSTAVAAGFAAITAFTFTAGAAGAATAQGSIALGGSASATGAAPPPAQPSAPSSGGTTDPFRSGGYALWYSVAASYGGTAIAGATDLRPTGGSITDTTKPGVRRALSLNLAPEPGLFDLLSRPGTMLAVSAKMRDTSQNVLTIPMGVFDIDSQSVSVGGGGQLAITAPDLWVRIQRSKFVGPTSSSIGRLVTTQIGDLIKGALGASTVVTVTASSQAVMGPMTWEKDRDKAILDLAANIGAWVYADRSGNWTIADVPTVGASSKWLFDANPSGVLLALDRQQSRTSMFNVVCVEPQASGTPTFQTTWVWDTDPNSDTYAGPSGLLNVPPDPSQAGPFGLSIKYVDTALPLDPGQARQFALSVLAQTIGAANQSSVSVPPNPSVDAGDVFDVLAPRERYDFTRTLDRRVAETVTHPLAVDSGATLHIDGRSTRTDAYT